MKTSWVDAIISVAATSMWCEVVDAATRTAIPSVVAIQIVVVLQVALPVRNVGHETIGAVVVVSSTATAD